MRIIEIAFTKRIERLARQYNTQQSAKLRSAPGEARRIRIKSLARQEKYAPLTTFLLRAPPSLPLLVSTGRGGGRGALLSGDRLTSPVAGAAAGKAYPSIQGLATVRGHPSRSTSILHARRGCKNTYPAGW